MPRTTQNSRRSAADSPGEATRRTSPPAARASEPAPIPAEHGALFRALVEAGSDAGTAYNADAEVRSMAAENLVAQLGAQMQVGFMEIKQLCKENAGQLAEHGRALAEHGRKLDALAEAGAERDRKLEFLAVRTGALRTEIRLVWGALGVLVTVLLAVFGLLFAR